MYLYINPYTYNLPNNNNWKVRVVHDDQIRKLSSGGLRRRTFIVYYCYYRLGLYSVFFLYTYTYIYILRTYE